jgi:hypothetical protein
LTISLDKSICHTIDLPDKIPGVQIIDSIVDEHFDVSLRAHGAAANIVRSTMLGTVAVETIEASDTIFLEELKVARLQTGCVRFCYVPAGSSAPRRYHCQPELALTDVLDPAMQAEIRIRITPTFTSEHYGDPGYGQLSLVTPVEIRNGAEDGSEMGAFDFLKQPQREANLRASMDEYLRFGLEAGIFYVT